MAKVNVERLAALGGHDVVRVAISNAKNIGGHTVASTREEESIRCLLQPNTEKHSNEYS